MSQLYGPADRNGLHAIIEGIPIENGRFIKLLEPLRPDGSPAFDSNVRLADGVDGKSIFAFESHVREVPPALQATYGTPRQLSIEEVSDFLRGCSAVNQGIVMAHNAAHPGGPALEMFGPRDIYGTCPTVFFGWYNEQRSRIIISPELSPEMVRIRGEGMNPNFASPIPPELISEWGSFANMPMAHWFREEYVRACQLLRQSQTTAIDTSSAANMQVHVDVSGDVAPPNTQASTSVATDSSDAGNVKSSAAPHVVANTGGMTLRDTHKGSWQLYVLNDSTAERSIFYGKPNPAKAGELLISGEFSPNVATANQPSAQGGDGHIDAGRAQNIPDVLIPFSRVYNDIELKGDRAAFLTACVAAKAVDAGNTQGTEALKYYGPRIFIDRDVNQCFANYPYIVKGVEMPDRGSVLIIQPPEIAAKWWTMSLSYMHELPQKPAGMIEQYEQKLGQRLTSGQLLEVDTIWREGEASKKRAESAAAGVAGKGFSIGSNTAERSEHDPPGPRRGREL